MFDNLIDKYLADRNLKYEDLTPDEKKAYEEQLMVLEKKPVDIEGFKKFIKNQIRIIEFHLIKSKEGSEKSIKLKGRLENMIIMESFLYGPERAKAALEKFLQNSASKIKS